MLVEVGLITYYSHHGLSVLAADTSENKCMPPSEYEKPYYIILRLFYSNIESPKKD